MGWEHAVRVRRRSKTWFRFETEAEAALESRAMNHAVERYFKQARDEAASTYVPPKSAHYIEQNIGLKAHIQKAMPRFLTLRDGEGNALVTAMLPPEGEDEHSFRPSWSVSRIPIPFPIMARLFKRWQGISASRSMRRAAIPTGAPRV